MILFGRNSRTLFGFQNGASKSTDEDDDEDWGEEEDLKKNHQELDAQIKGMIQTDDLEKSVDERCDKLRAFIQV